MDGFKHRTLLPDIGGPPHAHRTGDLRRHIAEDVPVKVGCHNHIKGFGMHRNAGCSNINNPMLVLNLRVLRGDFIKNLVKQTIGLLHDIVFAKATDFATTLLNRILKGVANNLFATGPRDQFETLHHLIGLLVLNTGVQVFFVFADNHQVHDRMGGAHHRMQAKAWPNIGI